jgi:hypothetical protein
VYLERNDSLPYLPPTTKNNTHVVRPRETTIMGVMPGLWWCTSRTLRSRALGGAAGLLWMSGISFATYLPVAGAAVTLIGLGVRAAVASWAAEAEAEAGATATASARGGAAPAATDGGGDDGGAEEGAAAAGPWLAARAAPAPLPPLAPPLASRFYVTLWVCYAAVGGSALILTANFFYVFRALDRGVTFTRAQNQSNLATVYWSTFSALGRMLAGPFTREPTRDERRESSLTDERTRATRGRDLFCLLWRTSPRRETSLEGPSLDEPRATGPRPFALPVS